MSTTEKTEKLAAFAHRLQLLAGRKRLRQVRIAQALSTPEYRVTPQRVGSWFQGRNFPGPDVEFALAELLGTTRDWLVEGKETTETTAPIVMEPPAATSPAESLRREVRERFERTMTAAGDDLSRLGYINEQLRAHLTPPAHWNERELTADHETAIRLAHRDYGRRKGSRERGQSDPKAQSGAGA